jgi:hypothetical protein
MLSTLLESMRTPEETHVEGVLGQIIIHERFKCPAGANPLQAVGQIKSGSGQICVDWVSEAQHGAQTNAICGGPRRQKPLSPFPGKGSGTDFNAAARAETTTAIWPTLHRARIPDQAMLNALLDRSLF